MSNRKQDTFGLVSGGNIESQRKSLLANNGVIKFALILPLLPLLVMILISLGLVLRYWVAGS